MGVKTTIRGGATRPNKVHSPANNYTAIPYEEHNPHLDVVLNLGAVEQQLLSPDGLPRARLAREVVSKLKSENVGGG